MYSPRTPPILSGTCVGDPTGIDLCVCVVFARPLLRLLSIDRVRRPSLYRTTSATITQEFFDWCLSRVLGRQGGPRIRVFVAYVTESLSKRAGTSIVVASVFGSPLRWVRRWLPSFLFVVHQVGVYPYNES